MHDLVTAPRDIVRGAHAALLRAVEPSVDHRHRTPPAAPAAGELRIDPPPTMEEKEGREGGKIEEP
jgi:hypothetical protein